MRIMCRQSYRSPPIVIAAIWLTRDSPSPMKSARWRPEAAPRAAAVSGKPRNIDRERERERETRERRESAARTRSSLARRRAGRSHGGSRGRGEGVGEETFPRAREERERTEAQRPMEVGKPRSPRQAARQGRKEKGEARIDPISYSRS